MIKIIYLVLITNIVLIATEHKSTVKLWKEVAKEYNIMCSHPKPISKDKKNLVKEANELFENTTTIISRLTLKPYIVEPTSLGASIVLAKRKIYVPPKYRDDLGRVGFMKNKPLIATAKKFLKFMKENHKGKIIHVKNPKNYKDLCDAMCGYTGLYIMRTEDNVGYKLTGYIMPWDGNKTLTGKTYFKYAREAYLFVD